MEKGALKVVCCNKRTKSWMEKEFVLIEKDLQHTHTQQKKTKTNKKKIKDTQTKRVNDLYVWCMMFWGHLPDSRYTGTLQNCLR